MQTWTVTFGFTLAFGAVIAKLYRVVHIFKNPSPNKTVSQLVYFLSLCTVWLCSRDLVLVLCVKAVSLMQSL